MWLTMTCKQSLVTKFGLKLFVPSSIVGDSRDFFYVVEIPDKYVQRFTKF